MSSLMTPDQLESAVDAFMEATGSNKAASYREWVRAGVKAVLEMRPKVPLEKCATVLQAAKGKTVNNFFTGKHDLFIEYPLEQCVADAKAILDAAGVDYE